MSSKSGLVFLATGDRTCAQKCRWGVSQVLPEYQVVQLGRAANLTQKAAQNPEAILILDTGFRPAYPPNLITQDLRRVGYGGPVIILWSREMPQVREALQQDQRVAFVIKGAPGTVALQQALRQLTA